MDRRYSSLLGRSARGSVGSGLDGLDGSGGGRHTARPRRGMGPWRMAVLAVAAIITGSVIYVVSSVGMAVGESYTPIPRDVAPEVRAAPVREGERINILFMALDDEEVRSDVMMLASVDMEQKRVGVISIPRDTRALLAGKGTIERINHAYAYGLGDKEFPANLRALKTVEDLLDVRIHYTVVLSMGAFTRAIDEIGGVVVDIPFKMEYDDPYQNLHIYFEPGRQKLNGQQALEFVRWRHNNDGTGYPDEDLGRIRAQQQFIRTVIDQVMKPGNLATLPSLITKLARYVESTVEPARLGSMALLAASLDKAAIEMATLPGMPAYVLDPVEEKQVSYYIHDPTQTRQMMDRLVHGIDPAEAAKVTVEVAAAPGDERAAAVVARLAEQGFVASLSAPPDGKLPGKTRVVPTTREKTRSLLVARSLIAQGFEVEMVEEPDPNANGVVRVILGADR
ncbi:MAG: LCP family protein [Bacillota bacterium]